MRKKRFTYLSLLNLVAFVLFFASLWFYAFDFGRVQAFGLGRAELEIILLQAVSFLLVLCAFQLPGKAARGWRPTLLTLSFVALSESSLVALLAPIG